MNSWLGGLCGVRITQPNNGSLISQILPLIGEGLVSVIDELLKILITRIEKILEGDQYFHDLLHAELQYKDVEYRQT